MNEEWHVGLNRVDWKFQDRWNYEDIKDAEWISRDVLHLHIQDIKNKNGKHVYINTSHTYNIIYSSKPIPVKYGA